MTGMVSRPSGLSRANTHLVERDNQEMVELAGVVREDKAEPAHQYGERDVAKTKQNETGMGKFVLEADYKDCALFPPKSNAAPAPIYVAPYIGRSASSAHCISEPSKTATTWPVAISCSK